MMFAYIFGCMHVLALVCLCSCHSGMLSICHACVYLHAYMCACVCICVCVCVCVCVHAWVHAYMCVYMCVCVCVRECRCMCTHQYSLLESNRVKYFLTLLDGKKFVDLMFAVPI